LPPISKLTAAQAMFHFISGYTAKVAGTEAGVTEPQLTFSACFGKAFLPLHPVVYAKLLGEKMKKAECKCLVGKHRMEWRAIWDWDENEVKLYQGNDYGSFEWYLSQCKF
jgi:hypothetical protein